MGNQLYRRDQFNKVRPGMSIVGISRSDSQMMFNYSTHPNFGCPWHVGVHDHDTLLFNLSNARTNVIKGPLQLPTNIGYVTCSRSEDFLCCCPILIRARL